MAYGLDFEEIYYTNHNRVDIGMLQTYEIDVDLAEEKDFRIESPEPVIPMKGFWYIRDTEYGGIVEKFETDSDNDMISYYGRSFRGILHSHYVEMSGAEMTVPNRVTAVVDEQGGSTSLTEATISDCIRELIEDCELDNLFVVDDPSVHETISPVLTNYVIKQGTTLYDAIMGMADSINFSLQFAYKSDHYIHITPILSQDYVDYIKGSKYEGLSFKTELDTAVTNHLIIATTNEDGSIVRVAHFWTDANGGIQPYKTVDMPIKDSQYIVDMRGQVLFGLDEVAEYQEIGDSAIENYEALLEPPSDWATNFASYYKHEFVPKYTLITQPTGNPQEQGWYEYVSENVYVPTTDTSVEIGKQYYEMSIEEEWNSYEAVGEEVPTKLSSKPSDWATNYSSYYYRTYDQAEAKYVYSNYSSESVLDLQHAEQLTKKPSDWASNYAQYYYKFWNGTNYEYLEYEGVEKNRFIKMTKAPDDWKTNFGNYYRKVFKKETEVTDGKKKILVDYIKVNGEYYTTCKKDDDKKDGKVPSFKKRNHYRRETYTVAPSFNKNNCYRIPTVEVAPTYLSDNCYSIEMVYHAPPFETGNTHQIVLDHYSKLVEAAIEFFEDERVKSGCEMELDYMPVNIGDTIGGRDDFTGTSIVGSVTNIEAKIDNGLIDLIYKVQIDDYTSNLVIEEA